MDFAMIAELLAERIVRDQFSAAKRLSPPALEHLRAARMTTFSSVMLMVGRPAAGLVMVLLIALALEALMLAGGR
jgi:hypothetical protein